MATHPQEDEYEDRDTFWRKLVLPQEERMRLGIPYYGGYRWFRSENVIPIEELRRRRKRRETPAAPVTPAAPEFDRATLLAVAGEQQQERNDNDDVIA